MKISRHRLTELAKDERVREEDLKKLLDSQLAQQSQVFGFLIGVVFGGILSVAVTLGIILATIFDILTQPVFAGIFIALGGLGLGLVLSNALSITSTIGLRYKIELMKEYLDARETVERKEREKVIRFE